MSFSLMHKSVAYLLSGLGLCALSLGSELSEVVLALIFVGYVASWFAEEKLHNRPHYASGWTFAVVLCLGVQVARGIADQPTLAMAIEFAAFLQISRLFNRRNAIDYQQIAVLALLHLIAATVLSSNLSYGAVFGAFVIATPWMLALSHLRREIEGNYPAQNEADPSSKNAIRRVLASKRVVGPSFLLGTALLSLPLFAMTLGIFITIPRVGQGFLSFHRDAGQHVAGFGSQIELGGFGVIRDDPTVVLRVMPQPKIEERAPRLNLRLRGTSFDNYDGRRWTRSPSMAAHLPHANRFVYPLRRMPQPGRDVQLQIVLDHLEEPVVFLPAGTVALSVPPRIAGGESIVRELSHAPGLDVRYESTDGLGLIYTAYVSRDSREAEIVPIAEERRADYLQVPPGHERVAELARTVIGSQTSDARKADRIENFLKRGQYTYSLEQPDVGKRLPLDVFLFDKKRGHCEYYSSAMAIMLRAVGIPSRNVTGFVGGQFNPYGGYYALRQGDAHSWVEAYLEGRGWVTFDPTPASRAEFAPRRGLWSDLNALIDAMRTRWTTSVIGYDLRVQVGMLQKLARILSALGSRGGHPDADRAHNPSGMSWVSAGALFRMLCALVALGVFAWLLWRYMRAAPMVNGRVLSRQAQVAVGLYYELERALVLRGHPRPASATPLEHARLLAERGFAQAAEVETVTRAYLEARYGGRPLRSAELAELKRAIARIKRAESQPLAA